MRIARRRFGTSLIVATVLIIFYVYPVLVPGSHSTENLQPTILNRRRLIHFIHVQGNWTAIFNCAVESAAKHNPSRTVIVWLDPNLTPNQTKLDASNIPNLEIKRVDLIAKLFKHPMTSFWTKSLLRRPYPTRRYHLSDFLRLLMLIEYGGTYMDSDFISVRSLPDFDFVSKETDKEIVNGIMQISNRNSPLVKKIYSYASAQYRPSCWNCAGPAAITRVFKHSSTKAWKIKITDICLFYPIELGSVQKILTLRPNDSVQYKQYLDTIYSKTIAVHLFNHVLNNISPKPNDTRLIDFLAKKECPLTLELFK